MKLINPFIKVKSTDNDNNEAPCNSHPFQKHYDDFINNIFLPSLHLIICPNRKCNCVGKFTIHAYYYRHFGLWETTTMLKTMRVRCKVCNTTHAIIPICIVAYSPIPVDTCCEIIYMKMQENRSYDSISSIFSIDKRIVKKIVHNFINEFKDDHLRIFQTLNNLKSITHEDIEKFLSNANCLYLVSKKKLNRIHHAFIPYSLLSPP